MRTILRLRKEAASQRGVQDRIADFITAFSGSMPFLWLQMVLFVAWIALNPGRLGITPFDPFSYGMLTMIVSLEAIFLATFVLVSQNRFSREADFRADLDLHIGLLTEHELTRSLRMLDAIQDKLGIANDADTELADLELETRPEDVLAELERLHQRAELKLTDHQPLLRRTRARSRCAARAPAAQVTVALTACAKCIGSQGCAKSHLHYRMPPLPLTASHTS